MGNYVCRIQHIELESSSKLVTTLDAVELFKQLTWRVWKQMIKIFEVD